MNQGNINLLTEEETFFLKLIINRGIKEIKPIIGDKGIQYEGLDYIVVENNYQWDKISDTLKAIVKKGIINKKEDEKFLQCPKCATPKVYTKYSCLKCESTHITNMRIVEHPFCGFTGSLEKIYVCDCPKLNNELVDISIGGYGVDFHKISLYLPYNDICRCLNWKFPGKIKKFKF